MSSMERCPPLTVRRLLQLCLLWMRYFGKQSFGKQSLALRGGSASQPEQCQDRERWRWHCPRLLCCQEPLPPHASGPSHPSLEVLDFSQ
ncbi:unnamed protein product [Coccothraustes coccothraustes]